MIALFDLIVVDGVLHEDSTTPEASSEDATEHSPLLGKPVQQSQSPLPESNGSSRSRAPSDAEPSEQTEGAKDLEAVQGKKRVKSLLPVLAIGIFLAFLDQSIVAAINGEMASELHALGSVSWIATPYFLTMTASQPLYGKLSDVFGRKPCLIFAYTAFGIGSLGCGVTRSMEGLVAARVGHCNTTC